MVFNFNGVKIFYQLKGDQNSKVTLFLHGWGCDRSIFDGFLSYFSDKSFLLVDFPPFGQSNFEPKGWNIFTYANMIISLIEHCNLSSVNVVGHSFGGRIAILVCALRPDLFDRCVLLDSAGIKPKRHINYYFKILTFKLAKKMGFLINNAGSPDYKNLSDDMKQVFKSIVNEPLDAWLCHIKQNTLIIFGENDTETPIYMAKKLHKKIKNSKLEILEHAGHFCFLDRPLTCFRLVDMFLEG